MVFNSFQFIWLFPLVFLLYWAVYAIHYSRLYSLPQYFLLFASYGLYIQWSPPCALILLYVTLVTYLAALFISSRHPSRTLLSVAIVLALFPLLIFKYYNFITNTSASVLANIGIDLAPPTLSWVVPLGLSFYTFQALGYLCDVWYRKISPEKSFLNYALFVSFFPQIQCGPISSASSLLPQIARPAPFCYTRAVRGLRLVLWGLFLKTVLADRIGIYVDTVYTHFDYYSGSTCLLTSIFFTLQIYGDFAGYSYIAIGVASLLGFDLICNFRRPFFASTITDFWKRWNISLTLWLTHYVYIPLGGNRKSRLRTIFNILLTFFVSGVWHGANFTFILWGMIHGLAECLERVFRIDTIMHRRLWRPLSIMVTFGIVTLAFIFFRLPTIGDGFAVLAKILSDSGPLFVSEETFVYITMALLVLIPVETLMEYRPNLFRHTMQSYPLLRWTGYLTLTVMILLFGVLDTSSFIYVRF